MDINIDPPNEDVVFKNGSTISFGDPDPAQVYYGDPIQTPSPLPPHCTCTDDGVTKTLNSSCPVHQAMARINAVQEQTPSPLQEEIRPREGAPDGNNNAEKFNTPEKRKALLNAYIEHVKSGLSKECFVECDMQTFRNYRAKYPVEFDTDVIEAAEREGAKLWEKIGVQGTVGKIAGFNAMSWKFNMQNRYKWKDRTDQTTDDEKIDNRTVIMMPAKDPFPPTSNEPQSSENKT